jgi:hypothetical protein
MLRRIRLSLVTVSCWWLLVPVHVMAQNGVAAGPQTRVLDVAIGTQGLTGRYVNTEGVPIPNHPIQLRQEGRVIATTHTATDGTFCFVAVRGGLYELAAHDAVVLTRVWAAGTAPPQASSHVVLVSQDTLVRGQRPFAEIITNPLVIGSVIAAAIAIPIAVHNSGKDRTGS